MSLPPINGAGHVLLDPKFLAGWAANDGEFRFHVPITPAPPLPVTIRPRPSVLARRIAATEPSKPSVANAKKQIELPAIPTPPSATNAFVAPRHAAALAQQASKHYGILLFELQKEEDRLRTKTVAVEALQRNTTEMTMIRAEALIERNNNNQQNSAPKNVDQSSADEDDRWMFGPRQRSAPPPPPARPDRMAYDHAEEDSAREVVALDEAGARAKLLTRFQAYTTVLLSRQVDVHVPDPLRPTSPPQKRPPRARGASDAGEGQQLVIHTLPSIVVAPGGVVPRRPPTAATREELQDGQHRWHSEHARAQEFRELQTALLSLEPEEARKRAAIRADEAQSWLAVESEAVPAFFAMRRRARQSQSPQRSTAAARSAEHAAPIAQEFIGDVLNNVMKNIGTAGLESN